MITISTRDQLAEMVDKNRDLIVDDNMTIEFSTTRDEIRNVKCDNLVMLKNGEYFNLNIGRDFTGRNFTGRDFTGGDFNGWNFTGWDFTGRNISYYAFFCCYGRVIKHGKIEGRHAKAHPPIELAKNKG